MELVIFSALEGLHVRAEALRDLALLTPSRLDQVQRLLSSEQPPDAIYLDDSRSLPLPDLWRTTALAQQMGVRVFINLYGPARSALNDAQSSGMPTLSSGDPEAVVAWLGAQLGLAAGGQAARVPVVAVGAAKGGIGKTFATCVLAEGLRRRGLRVLVWDSDISNPGLVPAFRVPSSAPSYLHLIQRGPAHWNPGDIRPFVYAPDSTRGGAEGWGQIDFLIGSHSVARAELDVRLPDWQGFFTGVAATEGYDLVLIDTPPDYLRRPYATHVLQQGGTVILPAPPGARERMGVGHLLDHFREHAPDRLDQCLLLFMEPERGVTSRVSEVAELFARRYPQVQALGTLPRSPRLASMADEHDGYVSMLDLGPHSAFSHATHQITDALCTRIGLNPRLPMPRISAWQRWMAQVKAA
ncbi:ATPase involved in chromosome partitioning-like protein [Oscillochloris trichoides DG-6]|uniref:ATPase involved in chromosome partitioning-like protein n=1 Tax=Oscillochloris trichoides DG-6 TaxID=765420 RepID=E1IBI7_9CHLR|nr:chromosome partitioning protein [Oscillochloris trichoides]EFO81406.1 ATPase involved in chromosome partitioning-like protein [Oscillochloris trichoides DG-6]